MHSYIRVNKEVRKIEVRKVEFTRPRGGGYKMSKWGVQNNE